MSCAASQRLVIIGGGHAHIHVLRELARQGEPTITVTLVTPEPKATYTGMVPGVIAGQYALGEAQIDVTALASRAGIHLIRDRVCAIDSERRRLTLEHHEPIEYDLASFDIGARPTPGDIAADAPVVWVKPIERAIGHIERVLSAREHIRQVVIVGAGAGGVELSFALRARLRAAAHVVLCDRGTTPVAERGARASRLVTAALAAQGIELVGGIDARGADATGVLLADGGRLPADLVVWATGAAAPSLFAAANLPVDARGFLQVDSSLRCVQSPAVFAAGDCIALENYRLPKAGVFAVRQGPVLAANLRLRAQGVQRLQSYQPQRRFLSLLNTCDGRAVLAYGRFAVHTRWALRLKDFIDRRFVAGDPAPQRNR